MEGIGEKEIKEVEKSLSQEEGTSINEIAKLLDKDMFFSAAIAYKKTTAAHKKKLEASMLPVYTKINEAINNGEYELQLWLTKDQKDFLYNKNFRLNSVKSENNKVLYRIYWG